MEIAWEAIIASFVAAFCLSVGVLCVVALLIFAASVAFWTTLILLGVVVFIVSFGLLLQHA